MSSDRIRVLFVDDEEGNLKAFRSTFRRDWEVFIAASGPEALELLERESVHIIVSDQRMPGMTGSEFLAIARKRFPQVMRMLLTGYADLEAVVQAVNEGGIYAYATKPWDANDLKLRVEQAYEIQQLREEKDKLLHQFKQVFEASGDPIVIVDKRGAIHDANKACARLLAISREDLLTTRFGDHLQDPRGLVRSLKQRREGDQFVNVDLTLRNKKGDLIDCLMTANYLGKHADGRELFQAIIKDISDRKQEEKRLMKLNSDLDKRVAVRTSQLLEALEDLGSFSYTVAHDLRSPLKNIIALSDMLQMHSLEHKDTEGAAYTQRIQKGAQRLVELVDDLLRFSQTNTRELELRDVLLADLIATTIEEQVPEERRDQLIVDIPDNCLIQADAPMLKVVLHNLLSNALKFTREESLPRIEIGACEKDGMHVLHVKDNGVGFDSKHNDQVFGIFKRLHAPDHFEGTGVGLAIVQRVVGKHGGRVWAESAPGVGTTVFVALPMQKAATAHSPLFKVA